MKHEFVENKVLIQSKHTEFQLQISVSWCYYTFAAVYCENCTKHKFTLRASWNDTEY